MPWGPLGITAVLAVADWGAWEWAISANHPTLGLIAGLLMAPIIVALAWSLVRVALALAQLGLRRAGVEPFDGRGAHTDTPFDIEAHDERLAA